jgi:hypothetical protein
MFRFSVFVLALALLAVALVSACPDPTICDSHQDDGSCGVACCTLQITVPGVSAEKAAQLINQTINATGPDQRYTPMMTAEGTLGFADLREYYDNPQFIGQAEHVTDSLAYTDTINFLVSEESDNAIIKAFSISQTAGAYNDEGQNYYNIYYLLNSIDFGTDIKFNHDGDSCHQSE